MVVQVHAVDRQGFEGDVGKTRHHGKVRETFDESWQDDRG